VCSSSHIKYLFARCNLAQVEALNSLGTVPQDSGKARMEHEGQGWLRNAG